MTTFTPVAKQVSALVSASPSCLLLLSPDLKIAAVSDAYLSEFGGTPADFAGRGILEVLAESDSLASLTDSLETVRRTQQPHHMIPGLFKASTASRSNLHQHLLEIVNSPVVIDEAEPAWIIHLARPPERHQTGRDELEAALHAAEARFRSVLRTVPDAMIIIDDRGRIESLSATAERLFGYSIAEAVGKNISMFMPSPHREQHDGYLDRYLATGERHIIGIGRIVVGRRKDGTTFPMHLTIGELRSGDKHYFTGFIRDLTDQQMTEGRLRELQSEVTHMSRFTALGEMASTLAHEINQPLTAIHNYLRGCHRLLDRMDSETTPMLKDALTKASDQALRAGQIIRRLREFVARGDSERRIENLSRLIEDASTLALVGAKESGIAVTFRLDPGAELVLADRIQIQQVLVNLIRNAIDVLTDFRGSRELEISSAAQDDNMMLVSVADSGPGLAPEIAANLFQPFLTTKEKGMGLGLSICRTIIEAHGGRIWVDPRPGGGTIFRFTLRAASDEETSDAQ